MRERGRWRIGGVNTGLKATVARTLMHDFAKKNTQSPSAEFLLTSYQNRANCVCLNENGLVHTEALLPLCSRITNIAKFGYCREINFGNFFPLSKTPLYLFHDRKLVFWRIRDLIPIRIVYLFYF